MTNVLIVLTLPEPVRMQYFNHIRTRFSEVRLDMVDHHSKVDPYIGAAEVLITFGPQVANHVFEKAKALKWVQALGTGVDGITDQPGLPRVLLIGDSISMGYTLSVRAHLQGRANVHHPPENCGDTGRGLRQVDPWLGSGRWDVIHFSFGLHDLKYLNAQGKYVPPEQGRQVAAIVARELGE